MSEWLSYSLSDFMMFSQDAYFRLFELHNRAVWPWHIAVLASAAVVLGLALRGGAMAGRMISAILAAFWLACAWSFHLERYASINLAAPLFAASFGLQALLLAWIGVVRGGVVIARKTPVAKALAPGILLFAFAGYPLLAPLSSRPWLQAEIVGLAPDPTAAATLALALLANRPPWPLLVVPSVWSIVTGATLWTIGAPGALLLPVLTALTLAAATWRGHTRDEERSF
ncbi:MAG: DUF6064 family protein [Rhodospirillales bacterium]